MALMRSTICRTRLILAKVFENYALSQGFAEFDSPLIKRIGVPDRALREGKTERSHPS